MKVTFEGYSDDTFGAYWDSGDVDHDDAAAGTIRTLKVEAGGYRMAVTGVFNQACHWSIGIGVLEEDDPMPPWPMTWEFKSYTPALTMELPDDFEITLIKPKRCD